MCLYDKTILLHDVTYKNIFSKIKVTEREITIVEILGWFFFPGSITFLFLTQFYTFVITSVLIVKLVTKSMLVY